ncbi:hypothetical protein CCS92_34035, partial [Methylobacterium radiotolerans]
MGAGRAWADALSAFGARAGARAATGAGSDAGRPLMGAASRAGADPAPAPPAPPPRPPRPRAG